MNIQNKTKNFITVVRISNSNLIRVCEIYIPTSIGTHELKIFKKSSNSDMMVLNP